MPVYLAFSPEEAARAGASGHPLACLGYQLAPDAPALLAPDPLPEAPSLMVLQDSVLPQYTPTPALARLVAQYAAAFHSGLVCDCDRPVCDFWSGLLRLLDPECAALGLPLWVPERYAEAAPRAWVTVGSDLSGGVFSRRMRDAAAAYPDRCVLELRPVCARFPLPCPTGEGVPLTPEERLTLQGGAPAFDSPELLCSYFSVQGPQALEMVLFDTRASMAGKLEAAREAGFRAAVGLLQELAVRLPEAPA